MYYYNVRYIYIYITLRSTTTYNPSITHNLYDIDVVIGPMAMQQEPIDWRYLPYIRPAFRAYVREEYLHFRILKFPLI